MLYLYDEDRVLTTAIAEHSAIVTTERFYEESEWQGEFPLTAYDALDAAFFARVPGTDEAWLVESVVRTQAEDGSAVVRAGGRSATALLHLRAFDAVYRWIQTKPGAIIKAIIDGLTGDRAIAGLAFGTGDTLGSLIDYERGWQDVGDACFELAAAATLGLRARFDGTSILIDVYGTQDNGVRLGEKYGNATSTEYGKDRRAWRNYAVVAGNFYANVAATTKTITGGTQQAGTGANIDTSDNTYWVIREAASGGTAVDLTFPVALGRKPVEVYVEGFFYNASASDRTVRLWAYDYKHSVYELLDVVLESQTGSPPDTVKIVKLDPDRHYDPVNLEAKVRLIQDQWTGTTAHYLNLDRVYLRESFLDNVNVDLTNGGERRELYVDGSGVTREDDGVTLTEAQYRNLLTSLGTDRLADTRSVQYARATVTSALPVGSTVLYDAGPWAVTLIATELQTTREGAAVRYEATLGEPPVRLRKVLRMVRMQNLRR